MAKITAEIIDEIKREADAIAVQTGLKAQGVKIKNVEYVRESGLWYLRVTLSKTSGISVCDCETLHRPLSKRLDEIDPIPDAYYLEVCSDGSSATVEAEIADGGVQTGLSCEGAQK